KRSKQLRMPTRPRLRSGNASMITTTGSFLGTVIMRPIGRTCFGRYWSISSAVPRMCCVTHSPGPQKNGLGSAQGFSESYFIPHTCDKINTALFLWFMILGLGTRVRVLIPVLVPSVSRDGGQHGHLSNCPASAEVFRAVIIKNCPKDTCP